MKIQLNEKEVLTVITALMGFQDEMRLRPTSKAHQASGIVHGDEFVALFERFLRLDPGLEDATPEVPAAPTPKPHEQWTPLDGQHPRDSVTVSRSLVEFAPAGGGLVRTVALEKFLEVFKPAPQPSPLYLEYFSFDDEPWILGWTNGRSRNGWGCPLIEKSCLEAYLKQFPETFVFTAEGHLRLLSCDDEDVPESVQPQTLVWEGKELTVFNLGDWGLTWNHAPLDLDDTEDYGPEDALAIGNAIIPAGFDRTALKPRQP